MTTFIDEVRIRVKAGDGGNGAVAFRREKFVPKGGPAGGDGGDGGSVILTVDEGLGTLLDFRYRSEYRAESGLRGGTKDQYGRRGQDLCLRVPPGTQVWHDEDGRLLADLIAPGQSFVLAEGGKGGRGNIHFATSTNRTPRHAEPGTAGQEVVARLELKLLADVGVLGMPNVGKSSLIARISSARPKVADYPFTTLIPQLGVVRLSEDRTFVAADIPGLIPGAHHGAGLGDRFLRHLQRTRLLIHMIEQPIGDTGRSPLADYLALRRELEAHDARLASLPEVVVLSKLDLPDTRRAFDQLARELGARDTPLLGVSTVTGEGLHTVLEGVWSRLQQIVTS